MAKTYTSTYQLRCVKEHTCASCGTVYRYTMARKVAASSGRSAAAAQEACRVKVERTAREDTDPHACPTCGLLQPDMVGRRRGRGHRLPLLLGVLGGVTVLILRGVDVLPSVTATWVLAGLAAVIAVAYAAVEGADPNRNLDGNRARATNRVADGTVTFDPPARPAMRRSVGMAVPGRAGPRWLLVGLVLLAPLVAAVPEVARQVRRWPANDGCYPPVVGPGDATRVYMRDKIDSVKGYYRGVVHAMLLAEGGSPVPVAATTKQNDWGHTISVKSDEKRNVNHPYVDLTLPADPALAGRRVQTRVHLAIEYPSLASGGNSFETAEAEMDEPFPMALAGVGAGAQYNTLWWIADGGAVALLVIGGFALRAAAGRLQRATTARVLPAA